MYAYCIWGTAKYIPPKILSHFRVFELVLLKAWKVPPQMNGHPFISFRFSWQHITKHNSLPCHIYPFTSFKLLFQICNWFNSFICQLVYVYLPTHTTEFPEGRKLHFIHLWIPDSGTSLMFKKANVWMLYKLKLKVSQSCLTLCEPMDSPWNSLGQNTTWVAISFSRGSSQPTDQTQVSCVAGGFFTSWTTREAQWMLYKYYII